MHLHARTEKAAWAAVSVYVARWAWEHGRHQPLGRANRAGVALFYSETARLLRSLFSFAQQYHDGVAATAGNQRTLTTHQHHQTPAPSEPKAPRCFGAATGPQTLVKFAPANPPHDVASACTSRATHAIRIFSPGKQLAVRHAGKRTTCSQSPQSSKLQATPNRWRACSIRTPPGSHARHSTAGNE
jgi:hypothetical protein